MCIVFLLNFIESSKTDRCTPLKPTEAKLLSSLKKSQGKKN